MLINSIHTTEYNRLTRTFAICLIGLSLTACSGKEAGSGKTTDAEAASALSDASPTIHVTLVDSAAIPSGIITVSADPGQFAPHPDMFASAEATLSGLEVQPGGIAISAPAEKAPVEVRLLQDAPASRVANFESVVETTLDVENLLRIGFGFGGNETHLIRVNPDQYRIRISQGPELKVEQDLESLHFVLELWPTDQTGTKILKQSRLRESLGHPGAVGQEI